LAVRLPFRSNYISKVIYLYRALGRSRISRAPLGFAGAKPRLAAALAGCLPAHFIACAAQLVLQPGGGGCSTSVLTNKLLQAKNKSL